MRPLRGLLGAVLWILACVLGLVALVLCVTVILLPVGVPVLGVARRLFTCAVQLMLPRSLTHPVDEVTKMVTKKGRRARSVTSNAASNAGNKIHKVARKRDKLLA
jgi:hypothetical protein